MTDTISSLVSEVASPMGSRWVVGVLPVRTMAFSSVEEAFARQVEAGVAALNFGAAPNRHGYGHISTLKPVTQDQAHPASISASVGLGQQPLHTDGAHLRRVPDYIILWSVEVNSTPTRIWVPNGNLLAKDAEGIFVVRSGNETWFAPAYDNGNLRFDPVCMSPCDSHARELSSTFQSPPGEEVIEVEWDTPGKILVIANRRVLHGRAKVAEGDDGRRIGRAAYYGVAG